MAGIHGHGTTLSSASLGGIADIISISGPDQTRDAIDISTMDSASKFREFLAGMADAGEVTCELNYASAGGGASEDLQTLFVAGTVENWTIQIASAAGRWVTSGFISALGAAIPFDDKITQSVTIKFTGIPAFSIA